MFAMKTAIRSPAQSRAAAPCSKLTAPRSPLAPGTFRSIPAWPSIAASTRSREAVFRTQAEPCKLYYFDIAARGEPARIMFKFTDTPFEDVRFSGDDFRAKYKGMSTTGLVPFLELPDGSILCETMAIYMYVAQLTGMCPKDGLGQARCLEMLGVAENILQSIVPIFMEKDEDKKKEALAAAFDPNAEGNKTYQRLMGMEKLLASSSTKFYLSDQPSIADIIVLTTWSFLTGGFLKGVTAETLAPFPAIKAARQALVEHPKIVEMYKDSEDASMKP